MLLLIISEFCNPISVPLKKTLYFLLRLEQGQNQLNPSTLKLPHCFAAKHLATNDLLFPSSPMDLLKSCSRIVAAVFECFILSATF